jgi:hypothetical protein
MVADVGSDAAIEGLCGRDGVMVAGRLYKWWVAR